MHNMKHILSRGAIRVLLLMVCLIHVIFFPEISNVHAQSFSSSKRALIQVYKQSPRESFYCGCLFSDQGGNLIPDFESCGYKVRKQDHRANRIEWEHIVPAWNFGHQLQCWKDGGRKNCKKYSRFIKMESDMHNIVPVIGELNGDRSNYSFSDWNGKPIQYGACDVVVDFKNRKVQPPNYSRGAIARAYLYMSDKYSMKLSKFDRRLMQGWHKKNPVSEWECKREYMIAELQGNHNSFVSRFCTFD